MCVVMLLLQLLVRAAYDGALGHLLIPDPDNLHHLTPETLAAFVKNNYTGMTAQRRGVAGLRDIDIADSNLHVAQMHFVGRRRLVDCTA